LATSGGERHPTIQGKFSCWWIWLREKPGVDVTLLALAV